jgi:hypothetical protein
VIDPGPNVHCTQYKHCCFPNVEDPRFVKV